MNQADRIEAAKAHLRIRGYIAKDDSLTKFEHKDKDGETSFIFTGNHCFTRGEYNQEIHDLYGAIENIINGKK